MLFELLGPPLFGPKGLPIIPVGAASFEQADLLFGDMKHCCRESPTLRHHVDVYDTEILVRYGPGRAYRIAAVAGTNHGPRPSMFAADEIHEWTGPKERVHLVIVNGLVKRALAINGTTTAFVIPNSWAQAVVDGTPGGLSVNVNSDSPYIHFAGRGSWSAAWTLTISWRRG
jgi:hypothetical protein